MKLRCDLKTLEKAVRFLRRTCGTQKKNHATASITADASKLVVSAKNEGAHVSVICPAEIEEPGSVSVSLAWLSRMLDCFSPGPIIVEVEQSGAESSSPLMLASSERSIRLQATLSSDVGVVVPADSPVATVDGRDLADAVDKVACAVFQGESRPALRHVCVEARDKGVTLVGCDGCRMAVATLPAVHGSVSGGEQRLVSASLLKRLAARLRAEESVNLEFRPEGRLGVMLSNVGIEFSGCQTPYPNWKKILEDARREKATTTVVVRGKGALLRMLAAARAVIGNNEHDYSTDSLFVFKDGSCRAMVNGIIARLSDEVRAETIGAPIAAFINPRFLHDAVLGASGETVRLFFTRPTSPVLIVGNTEQYRAVVMPQRGMEEKLKEALAA